MKRTGNISVYAKSMLNFIELSTNPYPGRGIVIGISQDGLYAVQIYWIMGRSENSRNRVFKSENGRLFTEAADASKMKDPSLIIYNAMNEYQGDFVVTNGDQTDTIVQAFTASAGITLREALKGRKFEPDVPNFTPRISGFCGLRGGYWFTELSLLRKSDVIAGGDECERSYHEYREMKPGIGMGITTYETDGNPLPAFDGGPCPLPILGGNINDVLDTYWSILNKENRVSLAVKFINLDKGYESQIAIVNQLTQVAEAPAKV